MISFYSKISAFVEDINYVKVLENILELGAVIGVLLVFWGSYE